MSSAARAERRRQARAAAKLPVRLVYQRDGGDCLRAAVATVLGLDYDETPAASGTDQHFEAWRAWTAERDLGLAHYFSHMPTFVDTWIATVLMPFPHAVVMRRGELLHNPDPCAPPLVAAYASAAVIVGPRAWVQETGERTRELIAQGSPLVWPLPALLDPELRRLHPPEPVPPFLIETSMTDLYEGD